MSLRLPAFAAVAVAVVLQAGCETTEQKKNRKPPPPPPPGSELSTQPWARSEKDWELGRPAFLPSTN
jgi:hypothetical protein